MTYRCRVGFDKIYTECKKNEDRQTDRDSILIDLSSWYRESLAPKIEIIQDAIELKKTIRFKYYAPGGDTEREIEPYYLIFKWTSWYVYGHCYLRGDFRLFKLNRMDHIVHGASFTGDRKVPAPELSNDKIFPPQDRLEAVFDPSLKWQLVEEFGVDSFMEMEEGLCVQCMHIGPYDDESVTVSMMHEFMEQQGYKLDITDKRLHHEIYLSDARKVAPEKLRTVIRHPIKEKED